MHRLRLAATAAEDVRDIRIYSKAQFGAAVARSYVGGLARSFALLRERPNIGADESDLAAGVRGFSHRSHRIYHHVQGDTVVVIRILHHARDARRWIGDEA